MYLIINKTTKVSHRYTGNYPLTVIDKMVRNKEDVMVISTYSNCIKIPYIAEHGDCVSREYYSQALKLEIT